MLFLFAEGVPEDIDHAQAEEGIAGPCQITVIFLNLLEKHVGRYMQ